MLKKYEPDTAVSVMRKYMMNVVAYDKHASTEKMENGCPELCHLFCDVDDVTYGGLNKIGFSRTKTLGYGGDCCEHERGSKKD
jgi:hypothetical protein